MNQGRGGRRGGKDNRPVGVTRALLAVKQELQNQEYKDKNASFFGKSLGASAFGFGNPNLEYEDNPEALYPPMQVPGLARGEVPKLTLEKNSKRNQELEKIVEYEREFLNRLSQAPTCLLFNNVKGVGVARNDLRRNLQSQYVDQLVKSQSYLFPALLHKQSTQSKQIQEISKKEIQEKQMVNRKKKQLAKLEHQRKLLLKKLQTTKLVSENARGLDIYNSDDELLFTKSEQLPGELPNKRPKLEQDLKSEKEIKEDEEEKLQEKKENESEKDEEEEENEEQEFENEYYDEGDDDGFGVAGGDDDDDYNAGGYGSD